MYKRQKVTFWLPFVRRLRRASSNNGSMLCQRVRPTVATGFRGRCYYPRTEVLLRTGKVSFGEVRKHDSWPMVSERVNRRQPRASAFAYFEAWVGPLARRLHITQYLHFVIRSREEEYPTPIRNGRKRRNISAGGCMGFVPYLPHGCMGKTVVRID